MKLTNTIREAFVKGAMQDVPCTDYTEQIREIAVNDLVAQLPAPIRAVWDDPRLREYIKMQYGTYDDVSVHYPDKTPTWRYTKPLTDKAAKKVADLAAKRKAQDNLRDDLKAKLRGAAFSCTTRRQLVDLLPEFEKYLPADDTKAKTVMLPAVANIVADFSKAGWPKGAKK